MLGMSNNTVKKRPQHRRNGKPGKPPGERWTENERKFCEGLAQGMTQTDAARYAGYKRPEKAGTRLMRKPLVIQWLAQQEEMRRQATQNALNEQALEEVITRREVEANLAGILKAGKSESARVSASMALARINGWIVKPGPIIDRLKDKSADELEFISVLGRDPENAEELKAFIESQRDAGSDGDSNVD